MKKILITTMLFGAALTASADDYAYLNIVKTDGTGVTLPATGATITFEDGYLVAGSERILLADLSAMRFSNEATALDNLTISQSDNFSIEEADAVYDMQGREIAKSSVGQMRPGVYIIKRGNTTKKIQIR